MDTNNFIGHDFQLFGVERYTLRGGKAEGTEILHVKNGLGLELCLNLDRAGDILSLHYRGVNIGYLSPNGVVRSAYYDGIGDHWLKSFTAGFLTTSGLDNVGVPNIDEGEALPLHGSIDNTPVSQVSIDENNEDISISMTILDETIFGRKLKMVRLVKVSRLNNSFIINDRILNRGDKEIPVQYLLHINFGYPLLSDKAKIHIDSSAVEPRNEHAAEDIAHWMDFKQPTANYEERCYYHVMKNKTGRAAIYNDEVAFGVKMEFDKQKLPCFTEWKMMGIRDYVLGLEPGNSYPEGRNEARKNGRLTFLKPGSTLDYSATISIVKSEKELDF